MSGREGSSPPVQPEGCLCQKLLVRSTQPASCKEVPGVAFSNLGMSLISLMAGVT